MLGVINILRYVFYALDFIFGVMSWGVTADKLDRSGICLLSNSFGRAQSTAACSVVIAFGSITMILLIAIIVLRTLDLLGILTFSELIEGLTFAFMALIWFILAIVTVSVTNSERRNRSEVRAAIAGAWIAFLTHTGSAAIPFIARRQEPEDVEDKE